jgi:aryl-alcohol dehydrogenase-like predicted oxidoreductase
MELVRLGSTGLVVSELALGTFSFGDVVDASTAAAIFDRYRTAGGTLIDTADTYQNGRSEEVVGGLLTSCRDEVVVATKAYFGSGSDAPNATGGSRRALMSALEGSLRRLKIDCVDIYYLHRYDPSTPLEETMSTLADMVRQGKVRYVACSNFSGYQLERAVHLASELGCGPIAAVQNQYSMVERGIELEVWPVAADHGLAVQAWSPLSTGFLTGKYSKDSHAEGRFSSRLAAVRPEQWDALHVLRTVADELGAQPATVAMAWVRSRGALAVLGATKVDHLEPSLAALDLELDEDTLELLSSLCPPPMVYPYGFRTVEARQGLKPSSAATLG